MWVTEDQESQDQPIKKSHDGEKLKYVSKDTRLNQLIN